MSALFNHLWQSTVFALAAFVLTLALRNNRAAIRYAIWFVASCKFLIPFSVLVTIGDQLKWRPAPAAVPSRITVAINQVAQPFAEPPLGIRHGAPLRDENRGAGSLFVTLWLIGVGVGVVVWTHRWRRARAAVRGSIFRRRIGNVPVMSSPSGIEPGVFGVFRPVLLLPHDLEKRLDARQIEAIVAHELSHVRRCDNLTFAIHMLAETIFWFHPALWLIRIKLVQERERACDEAVLRQFLEPEVYAEGILNVCKYYVAPPPACTSGVSGASLKKRIETIMTDNVASKMNLAKRILLAATAVVAFIGPVAIGLWNVPLTRAQSEQFAFDVASVKPGNPDARGEFFNFEPGRFVSRNMNLLFLVALAYDMPFNMRDRISGEPDWARSARFDVEGKAQMPSDMTAKAREIRMKLMLRTLLVDRFKLRLRRETKEMPIYALTVGSNGPKLEEAKIDEKDCPQGRVDSGSCHVINGGMARGLHAKAADLADIVLFVSNFSDRPIVDKTGLQGLYTVETEGWADMRPRPPRPDGQASAEDLAMTDPARPTLFMIFDRLGLKLGKQRGPVDSYIVEHVERPGAN